MFSDIFLGRIEPNLNTVLGFPAATSVYIYFASVYIYPPGFPVMMECLFQFFGFAL